MLICSNYWTMLDSPRRPRPPFQSPKQFRDIFLQTQSRPEGWCFLNTRKPVNSISIQRLQSPSYQLWRYLHQLLLNLWTHGSTVASHLEFGGGSAEPALARLPVFS